MKNNPSCTKADLVNFASSWRKKHKVFMKFLASFFEGQQDSLFNYF